MLCYTGNPYPPVIEDRVDSSKWLTNVLLESAQKNLDLNEMTLKQNQSDADDFELTFAPSEGTAV